MGVNFFSVGKIYFSNCSAKFFQLEKYFLTTAKKRAKKACFLNTLINHSLFVFSEAKQAKSDPDLRSEISLFLGVKVVL